MLANSSLLVECDQLCIGEREREREREREGERERVGSKCSYEMTDPMNINLPK